jgi:hypothetical protein
MRICINFYNIFAFQTELPETLNETEKNIAIKMTGYQGIFRPFFAISKVLVFPSYREGFPNVVLQAVV